MTGMSDAKRRQLKFRENLKDYIEESGARFRPRRLEPQHPHVLNFDIERPGAKLIALIKPQSGEIGVGFEIQGDERVKAFDSYFSEQQQKEKAEVELGFKPEWRIPIPRKSRKVWYHRTANLEDTESWPEYFAWMHENLEKFYTVFSKIIEDFDAAETTPPTDL